MTDTISMPTEKDWNRPPADDRDWDWAGIPFGVTDGGEVVESDLVAEPHQLITGLIDAGTDRVVTGYARVAASRGHELAVLDVLCINGTYRALEDGARVASIGSWTPPKRDRTEPDPTRDAIRAFFDWIDWEMDRRETVLFRSKGQPTHWLEQDPFRLTPLTVVIADLPTVLARCEEAADRLRELTFMGASSGVYLIATAQDLSEPFVPTEVAAMFHSRTLITGPTLPLLDHQLQHTFGPRAGEAAALMDRSDLHGRAITISTLDHNLVRFTPAAVALVEAAA